MRSEMVSILLLNGLDLHSHIDFNFIVVYRLNSVEIL